MENIDIKKFEEKIANTNLSNISNIGDELRFQRELYNYINPKKKLVLKSENERTSFSLGKELAKFIEKSTGKKVQINNNNVPEGLSYEILCNIEKNNTNKGKKQVYSLDIYYERIYYLIKLYGFIKDDYDIFSLLNKYNIYSSSKNISQNIKNIKEKCNKELDIDSSKVPFSLKLCYISVLPQDIKQLLEEDKTNMIFLYKRSEKYLYLSTFNREQNLQFPKLYEIIHSKFSKLSTIERQCISLYLGKDSLFIDNILNNKIDYITLQTTKKILKYLELENTDIYYFINKRIQNNPLLYMEYITSKLCNNPPLPYL